MVNETFKGIADVVSGNGLMTSDIEKDIDSLVKSNIPSKWDAIWEGPENPSVYIKKVVATANNLHTYNNMVETNTTISICLSDFLNPTTFFNSLKQQTARTKGVSIDSLELQCDMTRSSAHAVEIVNL